MDNSNPRVPNSPSGKFARWDEYDNSVRRSSANSDGRSLTTRIPSEDGPNASSRASKETVPVAIAHVSIRTY